MKSTVADAQTRVACMRIETLGGLVVRLTDFPRDLDFGGGVVYRSNAGYEFTGRNENVTFSPAVVDLQGIADVAGVDYDQLSAGVFNSAKVYGFFTSWAAPVEDEEPDGRGTLGKTRIDDDRYTIEIMGLIDALNQSVGRTYTAQCTKTFGGQEYAGCGVDLVALTVTGTISAVTSASVVRDASRAEAADWFAMGTIEFTSGQNAGLPAVKVKRYEADGTIELASAAYYTPEVGDGYTMIPGCRLRRAEDCRGKYNNVLNFGGFTDIPTSSTYAQVGGSGTGSV